MIDERTAKRVGRFLRAWNVVMGGRSEYDALEAVNFAINAEGLVVLTTGYGRVSWHGSSSDLAIAAAEDWLRKIATERVKEQREKLDTATAQMAKLEAELAS